MSAQTKALIASFLRVLAGCFITALTAVGVAKGYGPLDFTADDWKAVANSVIGALVVTVGNYLRSGETRFGVGARDIGMGGEDTLGPGGTVQS